MNPFNTLMGYIQLVYCIPIVESIQYIFSKKGIQYIIVPFWDGISNYIPKQYPTVSSVWNPLVNPVKQSRNGAGSDYQYGPQYYPMIVHTPWCPTISHVFRLQDINFITDAVDDCTSAMGYPVRNIPLFSMEKWFNLTIFSDTPLLWLKTDIP